MDRREHPEVFYINYDEGDNPQLAGGLFLQDVLNPSTEGQKSPSRNVDGAKTKFTTGTFGAGVTTRAKPTVKINKGIQYRNKRGGKAKDDKAKGKVKGKEVKKHVDFEFLKKI